MANYTYDDYLRASKDLADIQSRAYSWKAPGAGTIGYNSPSEGPYDAELRRVAAEKNAIGQYLQSPTGQMGQVMAQLGISSGMPTSAYTPESNIWLSRVQGLLDNPDSIKNSAAYQFRFNEGQRALERGAAAKGMLNSGNTLTALLNYGQGAASQEYNNQLNAVSDLYKTVEGANASRYGADLQGQYSNKNALLGLYGDIARNAQTTRSIGVSNQLYGPGLIGGGWSQI